MNNIFKILLIFFCVNLFGADNKMSPEKTKRWIQDAILYQYNTKTADYAKYMASDFVDHWNGQLLDVSKWSDRMQNWHDEVESCRVTFDEIFVERNRVGTSYFVRATKKDGTELDFRYVAIYKIKHKKIAFCDELSYMMRGPYSDKEL